MTPTDFDGANRIRAMVFLDFWNFQLSINNVEYHFSVDWQRLGPVLTREALNIVDSSAQLSFEGMNVYGSHDPDSSKDRKFRNWASGTLDKFPGVQVVMLPRQRKRSGPRCPSCFREITQCPQCGADMRGTEEKGVDTRIATDMIKLAWVGAYDVAVLVSSDRDFVPVVEFLNTRGIKVIHATFPPQGSLLSQACWGNIAIPSMIETFRRH